MPAPAPFRNILVLVDGTESGLRAAEHAVQLAGAMRARLTAIAVVDTDTLRRLASVRILVEQEMREFEADLERSQQRYLAFVEGLAARAGIRVDKALRKGACHSAVLAEQKSLGADLIVIGGMRLTLTKLNLAARDRQLILDQAPCPVLMVK